MKIKSKHVNNELLTKFWIARKLVLHRRYARDTISLISCRIWQPFRSKLKVQILLQRFLVNCVKRIADRAISNITFASIFLSFLSENRKGVGGKWKNKMSWNLMKSHEISWHGWDTSAYQVTIRMAQDFTHARSFSVSRHRESIPFAVVSVSVKRSLNGFGLATSVP